MKRNCWAFKSLHWAGIGWPKKRAGEDWDLEWDRRKEERKGGSGAAGILPTPQGSWQTQEIQYLYPTAHAVKVLLAAPSGHLCEHRSWEEATGLHVVGDLFQAL